MASVVCVVPVVVVVGGLVTVVVVLGRRPTRGRHDRRRIGPRIDGGELAHLRVLIGEAEDAEVGAERDHCCRRRGRDGSRGGDRVASLHPHLSSIVWVARYVGGRKEQATDVPRFGKGCAFEGNAHENVVSCWY